MPDFQAEKHVSLRLSPRWVASGYRGPTISNLGNIQETPTNLYVKCFIAQPHQKQWLTLTFQMLKFMTNKYVSDDCDPTKEYKNRCKTYFQSAT